MHAVEVLAVNAHWQRHDDIYKCTGMGVIFSDQDKACRVTRARVETESKLAGVGFTPFSRRTHATKLDRHEHVDQQQAQNICLNVCSYKLGLRQRARLKEAKKTITGGRVNEKLAAPVYFIYTASLQPGNRRLRPLVQSCPLVSQFEYTPRGVKSMLLHIESLLRHLFQLGANVTSSMKQEIHNISQRNATRPVHQKMTAPRTSTENCWRSDM